MTSRIKNQPWPPEPWSIQIIGTQPRMFDAKGRDITNDPAAHQRMIACVNGFRGVFLVEHHVAEAARYGREVEERRREAWDRAEYLQGVIDNGKATA